MQVDMSETRMRWESRAAALDLAVRLHTGLTRPGEHGADPDDVDAILIVADMLLPYLMQAAEGQR
jgi:hypothetical protein